MGSDARDIGWHSGMQSALGAKEVLFELAQVLASAEKEKAKGVWKADALCSCL
jgi:hypothetical protein